MFKLLWQAILGGNPTSWIIGGLALVLVLGADFGAGYYVGNTHDAKIMSQALVDASAKATKAQSDKDAKDYAAAKADWEKRAAADKKGDTKYETIYKDRYIMVPNPTKAKVPAAAMKALNDPDLVGETQ